MLSQASSSHPSIDPCIPPWTLQMRFLNVCNYWSNANADDETGPSRCFPFWQEMLACYVVNTSDDDISGATKCAPALEDYYECLHHKKEVRSCSPTSTPCFDRSWGWDMCACLEQDLFLWTIDRGDGLGLGRVQMEGWIAIHWLTFYGNFERFS